MVASIALVLGLVIGVVVLLVAGRAASRHEARPGKTTTLGWSALWLGLVASLAGVLMMWKVPVFSDSRSSIALASAAMVVAVGAVIKGDRRWPTWVGLVAGLVPALFWIVFFVAELVGPAH